MGTLFSAFDLGSSGLHVAQLQLDITGHNIANVNKEGYSRQRVLLESRQPIYTLEGQIGRGVAVSRIERLRDEFLDLQFREQNPNLGAVELEARFYSRIEAIFLEPGENSVSERLNVFFDALNDFANNVESIPARQAVTSEAAALSATFNQLEDRLYDLRSNANSEVENLVTNINSIASRIADLNRQIRLIEAGGTRQAGDLRDDRGLLLDQLSRIVDVQYRERESGEIDVLIASEELVSGERVKLLETYRDTSLDPERGDLLNIRFAVSQRALVPREGELRAALDMRDVTLTGIDARIDTMASTIISEINRIHSQGNGLTNQSGTIRSGNPTVNAVTALTGAGLPFPITVPESFDIVVYDNTNTATTTTINVTAATTLNGLAAAINAVGNISASVVNGNTLEITGDPTFTYSFANDSSGALVALGVNGLFTGSDARNIGVNAVIAENPALLTSAYTPDVLNTGDNTAAIAMADVRDFPFLNTGASNINDYYQETVTIVGVGANETFHRLEVERAFIDDFERRRAETSGVNIDEEVTNLLLFQRAFEASARVITTTDRMLETLLAMAL